MKPTSSWEPHFVGGAPPIAFSDSGFPGLAEQCGDLDFDGRTRHFEVTYAVADESAVPWQYWWQWARGRHEQPDSLWGVRDSVPLWDTTIANIQMPLLERADGVAAVLLISNDGTYPLSDSAFLDPEWHAENRNLFVQHWAHITAPTLDSIRRVDTTATLWWTNHHENRPADSTIVLRGGGVLARLGHAATSSTHSIQSLGPGIYAYYLQHVTAPLLVHEQFQSNVIADTLNQPPEARFGVSCQRLPCTFADSSSDPDGSITTWLWTFGDGDSASVQDPSHTYDQGGWYTVRLVVTDDLGATDDTTMVAAPLQLGILGPRTVKPKVTCEWDANVYGGTGEMTYSWRIGGQEVGTDDFLYWYTGLFGFQITLIGAAGDGQVDTAAVSVTLEKTAPSCALKRG
jgi:chitodextrinase